MERVTTWRSSRWARWLGWTVGYALVLLGALVFALLLEYVFYLSHSNYPQWLTTSAGVLAFLVPTVLAFGIGVRFHSWWWGLGPLVAFGVLAAAMVIAVWIGSFDTGIGMTLVAMAVGLSTFGGLLSLVGLVGVWWAKRRQHEVAFRDGGPADDDSRSGQS
jgi:hypothetical protein